MNNSRTSLIVLLITLLISGCGFFSTTNQDPFYTDFGDFDHARIPLIKPYDAVMSNNQYGWQILLRASPPPEDIYYYYNLHDVRKIAVANNIIMIYSPFVENIDQSIGQKVLHWFIIAPDENIETGFDNETDFLNYIQTYGIEHPLWVEPDVAYEQLVKTGCLSWIPDCR